MSDIDYKVAHGVCQVELAKAASEIAALKAALAASDAVIVYYVSRNWPSYSDRERKDKIWTAEMMEAQGAAFKRHTGSSFIGPEPRTDGQSAGKE